MRDSEKHSEALRNRVANTAAQVAVPYDDRAFFESFYAATVRAAPTDAMTIGVISEMEARFHYNVTENSIIRALARIEPPPAAAAVAAWRMLRQRRGLRLLDVGSGTGHWVDFMMNVFDVTNVVAIELTDAMSDFLKSKYAGRDNIAIVQADIVDESLPQNVGKPVDYITAIGVMFHIVEDEKWQRALRNLANVLSGDGLLIVGGNFGAHTRDVQFHKTDVFKTWREHDATQVEDGVVRVNKRVRSLADWHQAATSAGLQIVDLVRSDSDPLITTPENDILVLRKAH